jgi:hypothetical protein
METDSIWSDCKWEWVSSGDVYHRGDIARYGKMVDGKLVYEYFHRSCDPLGEPAPDAFPEHD